MLDSSFPPWPNFTGEEIEAVSRVLRSNRVNYWTGDECRSFENEYAAWAEARHAIAVANGTVALDLALHGLKVGSRNGGRADDEVIVTPRTFIGSVSCVVNAGAVPVFADVELGTGNISAATMDAVKTSRTRAAIPVHLAGHPCDMDPIMQLARSSGFWVIEDCAQAHGAKYKGRSVGSIGDVGAWSFCQDKILSTGGEGGMVTTNDSGLWERMWSFKDHGKSWDAVYKEVHPPGFRWVHNSFGTNWRMTEMQAAIGRIQLSRMSEWTRLRGRNAKILEEAFLPFSGESGIVRLPAEIDGHAGSVHANYKYYVYMRPDRLPEGWCRDRIVDEISKRGVPCFQGSCSEVYCEKAFEGSGWRPADPLPNASELSKTSLMLLVHPTLTDVDIRRMAGVVEAVLKDVSGI